MKNGSISVRKTTALSLTWYSEEARGLHFKFSTKGGYQNSNLESLTKETVMFKNMMIYGGLMSQNLACMFWISAA